MNVLYSILAFGIVLGIIVLVHEFGHYIAARLMGVRVEVFSFGFGKRLFGKKIGDTDFRLSLIPLGGFVKMSGEEEFENEEPKPYDFHAKNRGQKIFILLMGPVMNLLLAFFIFTVINITGVTTEKYKMEEPRIGYVKKDSPAAKAGLKPGDLIRSIDGRKIDAWKDLDLTINANPNETLTVEYERGNEQRRTELDVRSATKYDVGDAGLFWDYKTVLSEIAEDSPAAGAGIKDGDIILAVDGKPLSYPDFTDVIGASAEKKLSLKVKRDEEIRNLEITPRKVFYLQGEPFKKKEEADAKLADIKKRFPGLQFGIIEKSGTYRIHSDTIETRAETQKYGGGFTVHEKGLIGVGSWLPYSPIIEIHYGLWDAMVKSKEDIVNLTFLVFKAFRKMIVGKISARQLSGPIEIAKFSQKAMARGPSNLFMLIAFISLQLGLVNLFPIPALDGGHLMIYSIEAIIRKDFSARVKTILLNTGFFLLITLMVFVLLNDVAKILPNGWSSFWPFS
ncbi:MAG: RIP metalloprotease RseP [bacterium]|nr:RIP metalloprotease RseP [bacterium]